MYRYFFKRIIDFILALIALSNKNEIMSYIFWSNILTHPHHTFGVLLLSSWKEGGRRFIGLRGEWNIKYDNISFALLNNSFTNINSSCYWVIAYRRALCILFPKKNRIQKQTIQYLEIRHHTKSKSKSDRRITHNKKDPRLMPMGGFLRKIKINKLL